MANDLSAVIPQLLAQGLIALRQTIVMPRIVNTGYSALAGSKGSTIDVPIASAVTVQDVTAAATPPSTASQTPTSVSIPLDKWKEAPFYLDDKDMLQAMNGFIPLQAAEAIKSLANQVDTDILANYVDLFGFAGVAGTTPFAVDTSEHVQARKILNKQLCPKDNRFVVLDPDAEGNALMLRAFQDASFGGGDGVIVNGQIGRKMGALWLMSQNIPSHTLGAAGTVLVDQADVEVGDTTVHFDGLTTKASAGDVFTVAGDTQTYKVTSATDLSGTDGDMVFYPAAKVAWANDAAVTFKASHVVNLEIHRDCFAFANRPLETTGMGLGNFQSVVDPESGLTLRLEVTREHKRTRFSYDMLYGSKCVRKELGCRLAG